MDKQLDFSHITVEAVREFLNSSDPQLLEKAVDETRRAWWDDNNEGEKVALTLPYKVYRIRENAMVFLDDVEEYHIDEVREALIAYWSN